MPEIEYAVSFLWDEGRPLFIMDIPSAKRYDVTFDPHAIKFFDTFEEALEGALYCASAPFLDESPWFIDELNEDEEEAKLVARSGNCK